MICKNCGKENLNDMIFCGYCGNKLMATAPKKPAPKRKSPSMLTSLIVLFMAVAAVWIYNYKENIDFLKKNNTEQTKQSGDMLQLDETVALANTETEQSTPEGAFRMYYEGFNTENAEAVFAVSVGPYAPGSKEEAKTKEALQSKMSTAAEKSILKTVETGDVYTGQAAEKIAAYLEEAYGYTFADMPLQEVACLRATAVAETEEGKEYSAEAVMLKVGEVWYYDENIIPAMIGELL